MTTSLRIKKKYFDLIRSGEKIHEYRKDSDFYRRIFEKRPQKIILHYQREERLIVDVNCIRLIKTPEKYRGDMLPTKECFRISVSNPKFYRV